MERGTRQRGKCMANIFNETIEMYSRLLLLLLLLWHSFKLRAPTNSDSKIDVIKMTQ